MAFDRPLEADRVDDLNFFGAFLRAPVVGTLMWILGGEMAKKEEEEEKLRTLGDTSSFASSRDFKRGLNPSLYKSPKKSALKKAPPSLVGSEISDIGECAEALDGMHMIPNVRRASSGSFKKGKKELSWSDESGQNLVEYIDNDSSTNQESFSREDGQSSVGRVMSRSGSVRSQLEASSHGEKTYLPRSLLSRQHNGIVMPTKPYGSDVTSSASGDVESPQWGWYITTTPPTPEMYYASRTPKKPESTMADTSESTLTEATIEDSSSSMHEVSQPNKVFRGLQDKSKDAAPIGFPAVPL